MCGCVDRSEVPEEFRRGCRTLEVAGSCERPDLGT